MENLIEGTKFARKCSATGEGMNEGFCIGNGEEYFKYEIDLFLFLNRLGYQKIEDAHNDDVYYYTEWEMPEDAQYIVKDGKLVDIDNIAEEQKESSTLDALREAESFISGFENSDNEEEQKTVDRILKKVRSAIEEEESK